MDFRTFRRIRRASLLVALLAPSVALAQQPARPWMVKSLSPDRRASLLLAAMTPDEKFAAAHWCAGRRRRVAAVLRRATRARHSATRDSDLPHHQRSGRRRTERLRSAQPRRTCRVAAIHGRQLTEGDATSVRRWRSPRRSIAPSPRISATSSAGVARPRAARARGAGTQPRARAAGRTQLRVLRRRSRSSPARWRSPRSGDPGARRDRDGEALRRQRAGDEAHDGERDQSTTACSTSSTCFRSRWR